MIHIIELQEEYLHTLNFEKKKDLHRNLYKDINQNNKDYMMTYGFEDQHMLWIGNYQQKKDFKCYVDDSKSYIEFGFSLDDLPQLAYGPSSIKPRSYIKKNKQNGRIKFSKNTKQHGVKWFLDEDYYELLKNRYMELKDLDLYLKEENQKHLPEKVIEIILEIYTLSQKNALTSMFLEIKLLECLWLLVNCKHQHVMISEKKSRIALGENRELKLLKDEIKILQHIKSHLDGHIKNPPSVESLSKKFFIGEQKIYVGFKYLFDMTVSQYIMNKKMQEAQRLLVETDMPVEDISINVGYSHPSNFVKAFKKTYKKTPLKYRREKT